ncbi:MAG: carboxyl transferase, partial [Ruminococcus sp.]|nr:carboxyl transferase [Ruminococcus sp.]
LITGNAVGSVFVAMAGSGSAADAVFALPGAVISPIAPEAAVEFLWHDRLKGAKDLSAVRSELVKEYCDTLACAVQAAQKGAVDEVVSESEARAMIISAVEVSAGKRLNRKLPKRHNIIAC